MYIIIFEIFTLKTHIKNFIKHTATVTCLRKINKHSYAHLLSYIAQAGMELIIY